MKKIFVLFGIVNLVLMGLLVAYYADALNVFLHLDIVNNGAIIDFVDNKFLPAIPSVIVRYYYVLWVVANPFGKSSPRIYLFVSYVLTFVVAIVTLIKILDSDKKHYFSCILRLAFSPVTAVLGFVITSRSGKDREAKRSRDELVSGNNKVANQPKTSIERVKLVMPNKPIILTIIVTIISIAFLSGFVVVFFYIKKEIDKHASDLPGISFILIFIGIILGIIIFVGLPTGTIYFYRTKYLERCYRAIKKGTSFEDAKPIFKYFEKYTNISSDEASRIIVIIKVKAGLYKHSDHETKYFEYVNGILVDKDYAYQRTTTTYY